MKRAQCEAARPDVYGDVAGALWHLTLDLVGFVPVVGEFADGLNALSYLAEGDVVNAAISAGAMVTLVGDVGKAVRYACSFTGDTPVLMADGTTKPISQVTVGDQVLAIDPETGEHGARTVTATWAHHDTVLDLTFEGGGKVTTTENHPYWNTTDKQWQPANRLDPGDQLRSASGLRVRVNGLQPGSARNATAYNLTITDIHTYHVLVGNQAILVHNDCDPATNATVRDLLGLTRGNPLEEGKIKAAMSDSRLLDSVFNPLDGPAGHLKVSPSGTLLDGNHRASELVRRAADPGNENITWDTPIYIHGFRR